MTDASGAATESIANRFVPPEPDAPARSFALDRDELIRNVSFRNTEIERQSSFFTGGGLVAAHASRILADARRAPVRPQIEDPHPTQLEPRGERPRHRRRQRERCAQHDARRTTLWFVTKAVADEFFAAVADSSPEPFEAASRIAAALARAAFAAASRSAFRSADSAPAACASAASAASSRASAAPATASAAFDGSFSAAFAA